MDMKVRKFRYFVGDFETTVYDNQDYTEVWASALVEMYTEDVEIVGSIGEQFERLKQLAINDNIVVYYHNLKFDGSFWLAYLLQKTDLKQAYLHIDDINVRWLEEKYMLNNTFKYSISEMGQWYSIIIKVNNHIIELRDSLKLLPYSVKEIGNSFNTKYKKLEMEYKGFRFANCYISEEEKEYIKNDVLVVKEALEIMFNDGHDKLTIGSCCMQEYKKQFTKKEFGELFPDLYKMNLEDKYGAKTVGDYIRKAYKGGWCYLVKGKENKIYENGITLDVNSLYPSVMHSDSGNRYPYGFPTFWQGNFIPYFLEEPDNTKYWFIRIKTRFTIKEGMLPFIQAKGNLLYRQTEMLETSDVYDIRNDIYYSEYIDEDGNIKKADIILTLTCTDYILFREHYNVSDFEILDGCYFESGSGLFDEYIEKYKRIKMTSKGAMRTEAKLFLNNLYGKFATNTDSSFKVCFLKEDNTVGFYTVNEYKKKAGYIAIGAAITSYARNYTIRAAQENFYGADNDGFIYSDTDSIHLNIPLSDVKGVEIDDKEFGKWAHESSWDKGIFVRQKTYMEHITDDTPEGHYDIKCAGMPTSCKNLLRDSILGIKDNYKNDEEKEFLSVKRDMTDFKVGLKVPSKLLPQRIEGGIVLVETTYQLR